MQMTPLRWCLSSKDQEGRTSRPEAMRTTWRWLHPVRQHCGALRRTVPATEKWLRLTGQDVNAGKSTVWTLDSDAGKPIQLLGVPIPEETEFRRLGIGIRVPPVRGTGPLLKDRIQRGASVLRRMPQLTSLPRRSTVASSLAMVVALHGVQLADTADVDLARLETQTVRAIWGRTRPGRAKEVVFSLLTPGHRTPPTMRTKYERLVWMAQLAWVPGAAQVLMQAIWECGDTPPPHGPAGRAVRTAMALGWAPMGVWWRWCVPG